MSLTGGVFKQKKIDNVIFGDFLKNGGSNDMTNNYALSAADFTFTAPTRLEINSIVLLIRDASAIHYELFGSISALTNGVRVWYKLNATSDKVYLDAGYAIKVNSDFAKLSIDIEIKEKSAGDNVFAGSWNFKKHFGDTLMLNKGGSFGVTLNDNLSGLDVMTMFVKGFYHTKT
jgi:hypothetical protein